MVVMLAYADRFEWARVATWVFWPLYLFLPVNSAVFLWRLRDWQVPEPLIHLRAALIGARARARRLRARAAVVPGTATGFWPWPVDAFHARIYAATYLTPAVGAWVIRGGATRGELRTLGITLVTFGIAAIVAVLVTDPIVPAAAQVDYDAGCGSFFAHQRRARSWPAPRCSAQARASAPAATPA